MKNITTLFFGLFLTVVIFSSCNKVKDLADVEFDATYNTNLDVDMTTKGSDATFETESTIDPASDPTAAEYIDKIKSYNIKSMTAEVISINKNANLITCNMSVFSDTKTANWDFQNLPLSMGATIELGNESGQWDIVQEIFGEKTEFTVKMAGETDEDGLMFVVKVTIETQVTANPL